MSKVLLVEDVESNRLLLRIMLEKLGHEAILVDDGLAALTYLREAGEGSVDAVLMDLQLPVLDGLSATGRIREDGFVGLPIIAVTAHALPGDRARCLDAGMSAYLAKPFTVDELRQVLVENGVASDLADA